MPGLELRVPGGAYLLQTGRLDLRVTSTTNTTQQILAAGGVAHPAAGNPKTGTDGKLYPESVVQDRYGRALVVNAAYLRLSFSIAGDAYSPPVEHLDFLRTTRIPPRHITAAGAGALQQFGALRVGGDGTLLAFGDEHSRIGWALVSLSTATRLKFDFASECRLQHGALNYVVGDLQAAVLHPSQADLLVVGSHAARNTREFIRPAGVAAFSSGQAEAVNRSRALVVQAIPSPGFAGAAKVWNARQYVPVPGLAAGLYGVAYVQGGVKTLRPTGWVSFAAGAAKLVNTRATQTARPSGIAAPALAKPSVSPRMLRPAGILGAIGTPTVAPNPMPVGWLSSAMGSPAIAYKTKRIPVPSIALVEPLGYPRVFDPTQKILWPTIVGGGVFGDTAIRNARRMLSVPGVDQSALSAWATVENTRRALPALGFASTQWGGAQIANRTPSLAPEGIKGFVEGRGQVAYRVRGISPAGIFQPGYGIATLKQPPSLAPHGFAGDAGSPTVWPRVRTVEVAGKPATAFGDVTAWFRYRVVAPGGVGVAGIGRPRIEHGRRVLLGLGARADAYGSPWLSFARRSIAPASIWKNFASNHAVGGTRWLRPDGFDAALFGARIIPEVQQVLPAGFGARYGFPCVENLKTFIRPAGLTTYTEDVKRYGTPQVWNARQYVEIGYDPDSGLNPPAGSSWTAIANRNRAVVTFGRDAAIVPPPQIDNRARVLAPAGMAAPAGHGGGMVADRVRRLPVECIEAPYCSSWAAIYNGAAVLAPRGSVVALFGTPAAVNTRRYLNRIGAFDAAVLGYPFVAPRIRTLTFEGRYTIGAPVIALPEVKQHTRYIAAIGFESPGAGWPALDIHWNKIAPRWTLQNLYGSPAVRNLTPELRQRGRNSEEFGDAFLRLQWRSVATLESYMARFGRTTIADKLLRVSVGGMAAGPVGNKLSVVKTGAPPYALQTVSLDNPPAKDTDPRRDGYGIPPLKDQVPGPTLNQSVLYVLQPAASTQYGMPLVTANSIRIRDGIWEILFGDAFVSLKIRRVTVAQWPENAVFVPSRARVSPHTIYAVTEAPEQAKRNNPAIGELRPIKTDAYGMPTISLRQRRIAPQAYDAPLTRYGAPGLMNRRTIVAPGSIRSFQSGWHEIPGPRTLVQFDSADGMRLGSPSLAFPPYHGPQTIRAAGKAATAFGRPRVEMRNRALRGTGWDSAGLGTRKDNDSPYAWQGLRVGPLMPTIPAGFDAQTSGRAWVSFRVRELHPDGLDGFVCEYDLAAFDFRMRVRNADSGAPPRLRVRPAGFASECFAAGDVRPGLHFIRPDGNADQFRKGAF